MARQSYVQLKIDGEWKLVPREEADRYRPESRQSHMIMSDIQEFVSPVDGSVIGGRAQKREHMRRHGLVEVGNEKLNRKASRGYDEAKMDRGLRDAIARTVYDYNP